MFGGPMSANDADDWLRREIAWIDVPLSEEKPFLGICLGAQMLARHLGHRVYAHPEGKVEVGYYPIQPTVDGHDICRCPFPTHVYQWHGEGFELPADAVLLASGRDFEAQAFRYGKRAYGLQFHPEVTFAMMCCWIGRSGGHIEQPGACPREQHVRGCFNTTSPSPAGPALFLTPGRTGPACPRRHRANSEKVVRLFRERIRSHILIWRDFLSRYQNCSRGKRAREFRKSCQTFSRKNSLSYLDLARFLVALPKLFARKARPRIPKKLSDFFEKEFALIS